MSTAAVLAVAKQVDIERAAIEHAADVERNKQLKKDKKKQKKEEAKKKKAEEKA